MTDERVYGGQAVADRRRERRERFCAAGLDLFAGQGYAATSVPQVCRAAGLSTRQFYQEFDGREHLLRALYDDLQDAAMTTVATVVLAQIQAGATLDEVLDAGVAAFIAGYDDARLARVSFIEVVGVSPAFEEHRQAIRRRWAELLTTAAQAGADSGLAIGAVSDLQWAAYIGAVNAVIVERAMDASIDDAELLRTMRTLLRPGILG